MADEAALPDAGLEQAALGREVGRALESLPERQKAAILLCHFQGASNIEAAEIMDLSVEVLESLLARGRRTLRLELAHLKDFLGEG
jgi:RNA polymerase sigma-70 factor (ECF subfamily)